MKQDSAFLTILGVRISRLGMAEVLEFCGQRIRDDAGGYVCFANAHSLTEADADSAVSAALNGATLSVADGVPLVWTSKLRGHPIGSRVCGPDFMKEFIERHRNIRHGFLGGSPGIAEKLCAAVGVQGICFSPPMRPFSSEAAREDWKLFVERAGGNAPSVVWVGLGAPKQELWMREVSPLAPRTLFFGVGAAFDFLTGAKSRAPEWMQTSGLEWAYRFAQEPGRLWKRYLVGNSKFVAAAVAESFRGSERGAK